jgi:predicted Zn finger-like uncharacterized protein
VYGADNTADPTASLETRVIARCPDCQTRYRIEVEKIGPNGSRIRCSQCGGVFRVEPEAAPGQATQTLLVAEPDADLAKRVAGYLRCWQIGTTVVHDGGQALLFLHREKPGAVIVGARLPGLRGAEFAEIVRRTAELAEVKLIRVVSDDEAADWHFEADHALGSADLPDGLAPILERLGIGTRPATRGPEPGPRVAAPAPSVFETSAALPSQAETVAVEPAPARPAAPAAAPQARGRPRRSRPPLSDDPEIAAAERLARIIVSDIILYNDDKFAKAVRDENAATALEAELGEAGQLFERRIPEEVRAQRPFLVEELERRAKALRG